MTVYLRAKILRLPIEEPAFQMAQQSTK